MAVDCEGPKSCEIDYHFDFPVNLSPASNTYQVGDTIWVNIEYDNTDLLEHHSGEIISANEFDFIFEMLFENFTLDNTEDGFEKIHFGATQGMVSLYNYDNFNTLILDFEKSESIRYITYYLVPQQPGNFLIGFSSVLNQFEVTFLDEMCKETLEITFKVNEGENNNFQFYLDNSNNDIITAESYKDIGGFSFTVIE